MFILQVIKTKIIFVLFIYKLLSLVDLKCLYYYLEIFPCGYYIIDKIPLNFSFDLAFYNSLLEIDLDIMFIIICLFIILITLIIYNLMIIFIIMISFYNYKIYKFLYIIRKILPVQNMKLINKWCKIFGFISINILKVLNSGLSVEEILLICNFNFNKIFEFYLSNVIMQFMGNETQNITNSDNYNSSTSTSHNSLISSNKDNSINFLLDQNHKNETDSSDSSDSSDSNESSDKLFKKEFQNKEFKKLDFVNFSDFNKDFNLEDKYLYLKKKFYNKGIDHNIPFLDWFVNLLNKSDGTKTNIDNIIEKNLNHIVKIERETQLNNLAFFRNKPFLINKFDNSPIAYPNIIPVFKGLTIYGEEDIIEEKK